MAGDTVRTRSDLLDRVKYARGYSAQDLRDVVVSVHPPQATYAIVKYTSGNFTLNNTGDMAAVHASGLDLTVAVSTGDLVMLGVSGMRDKQTSNDFLMFDVGTIVSGSITNRVSGQAAAGNGVMGWFIDTDTPTFGTVVGGFPYVVVAGDISGGECHISIAVPHQRCEQRHSSSQCDRTPMGMGLCSWTGSSVMLSDLSV